MITSLTYHVFQAGIMNFKSILVTVYCILPFWLAGQTQPAIRDTSDNIILIDHFGKLIEDRQGSETVKWISQGMQLRIDSTFIYADSAVIYGEERVYAYTDVVIQQGDSLNVFTDTLYYSKETDVANLTGEVALIQGSSQLWTTHLTYYLSKRYGEYNHGGVLIDKSLQVSSKRGSYWARSEEVMFRDSVVVLHPKFNLTADSMRYLSAQSRAVFTGPTHINTNAAKIYCEGGYYDLISETAEFNRNPRYTGSGKNATADTIRYVSKKGEVEMAGNVVVMEEERNITGTYLRYLESTGETWIKGNPAVYKDSSRYIVSPAIFYNEKTNQVRTEGASEISIGDLKIKSERFIYDESTGIAEATGNAEWRDTTNDVGIRAEHIIAKEKSGYLLAYGIQRTIFYTIIEGDTLFISSDTLNMWSVVDTIESRDTINGVLTDTISTDTTRMMKAYNDVRLYKSDMQGLADSLVFNGDDSLFIFFGQPVLWSDSSQFSGDTIYMHLQNKQIKDVILHRRAMIISELVDTYYDQIKGKLIVANFDSSEIKEMIVTGNAESVYYTRDDQSAFIGVNQTICSKMFFTFKEKEIHLLKYYGDNMSTMHPMREVNHDTLRLEGFQWREHERPLSFNDLK